MTAGLPVIVVGAGSIGMRHVEVCMASDRVELVAVVEADSARRAELAAQGLNAVTTMDEAPKARLTILATPTQAHSEGGLHALSRGWGVLVEKPPAATLAEADRLVAAADKAGLPLFTGHHRRCHPFVDAARARLDRIGDLVGIQGCWSLRKHDTYYDVPWRKQPGAGPLLTNLTHEVDLIGHLGGEIAEVTAFTSAAARGGPLEDTASAAFRFTSGALGSFLLSDAGASPWSFEAASDENPAIAASGQDYLRFIGTRGAMEFPSLDLWLSDAPGETEWRNPMIRHPGPTLRKVDPLRVQLDRIADVMAGGEGTGLCTGGEGRQALAATLATALSAETGRPVAPADVPLDYPGFRA